MGENGKKYVPRLKEFYYKKVQMELMKIHKLHNKNEIPNFVKIVLNVGVGEAREDSKILSVIMDELAAITGQRPVVTTARKSIAAFKIRSGMKIGCKVTLRGDRMWEFFDRLVNVVLPRVRDFKGVSPNSFDKFNNYSLAIKEQMVFPEIDFDKVQKVHGMDITFVLKNAKNKDLVKDFLSMMGMPFRKSI